MAHQSAADDPLASLRRRIDEIDAQIVRLLNERAQIAIDIGKAKQAEGNEAVYAPDRERQVLQRIRELNSGPLPDESLEAVYREIMSGSFALQRPLRVGCLGPRGSFSHMAARCQFGHSVDYQLLEEISTVFQEVERGSVDMGLVPIENSTGGGVRFTLDCFMQSSVQVCAEVLIHVHQNLISKCESDDKIKRIYSHPEVYDQCRRWLGEHLRGAERLSVPSTAKAAEQAASEKNAAAISSSLASELYAVPIRHANIEDNPNNVTRFFIISRHAAKPTGQDKTAIMFTTAHKPGSLAEVINVFARYGINLTHIDKRPSQRVNWEYYFFIDCEGHTDDPKMIQALQEAKTHCLHLSVLGSFPKATQVLG